MRTRFLIFATLMTFSLIGSNSFVIAQEKKQEEPSKSGKEIAEMFEDAVVQIETTAKWDNGMETGGSGSGFFIDDKGHILTCAHVVKEMDEVMKNPFNGQSAKVLSYSYWVILPEKQKKIRAEVVGWNKHVDIALMKAKIDARDYKYAKLGDPNKLKRGDKVYAIGSPYDLQNTLTAGSVSGLHRYLDMNYVEDFIQTDAAINPGNSGGVLINDRGEVVGLTAAKYMMADNLGFAISIELANIDRLMKGEVKLGELGAGVMLDNFPRTSGFEDLRRLNEITDIDDLESLMTLARLTKDNCSLVTEVDRESPAAKADLQRGDLINSVNGKVVKNGREIRIHLLATEIGKEVAVKITRLEKGVAKELTVTVTLAEPKKDK